MSRPDQPLPDVPLPARSPGPTRRSGAGGILALLGLLLALGVCLLFGVLSLVASTGDSGPASYNEAVVQPAKTPGMGADKVLLIEIDGVIAAQESTGGLFATGGDLVLRIRGELERAEKDPSVKAVLLAIDSPGGTVTASDQIWNHVRAWRERTKRPVVVHMGALCCSGGYYIAAAGSELVCEPTTITGSIGVILSGMNFHELLLRYGVKDVTITSGANKDLLSATAPLRDSHVTILQGMVDEAYDRFTEIVAQGRSLPLADVRQLADGRIYTAKQALEKKLVDRIGYRDDAIERAQQLAGITPGHARLVRYTRQPTLADILGGRASVRVPSTGLDMSPAGLDGLRTPRLLALWRGASE